MFPFVVMTVRVIVSFLFPPGSSLTYPSRTRVHSLGHHRQGTSPNISSAFSTPLPEDILHLRLPFPKGQVDSCLVALGLGPRASS